MRDFLDNVMAGIWFTDILDIAIVAFAVYKVLGFIKESRAEQLVKGLLFLVVVMLLSGLFHLYALNWILRSTLAVGVIAIVVVFQPELRSVLERMGRSKLLSGGLRVDKDEAKQLVSEFVQAVETASETRTGMLLIIEREAALTDIADTGTVIDAAISAELIGNIFYEGSPLHDEAVIVRGDRLHAANCVLPLTENKELPKELGTRHRAGIGITEKSDALTIIVSEESGIISMAQDGYLERYLEGKNIEKALLEIYFTEESPGFFAGIKNSLIKWRGGDKDA